MIWKQKQEIKRWTITGEAHIMGKIMWERIHRKKRTWGYKRYNKGYSWGEKDPEQSEE